MSALRVFKDHTASTPRNIYTQKAYNKKQIVLHHTVSGDGVTGDIATMYKRGYVVPFVIERNGNIHKLYDEQYGSNHLGIPGATFSSRGIPYQKLDYTSIGIELDSWGAVTEHGGKYYPAKMENGKILPRLDCKPITGYPEVYCTLYRGFKHYERYTDAQLTSLEYLLRYLMANYDISNNYISTMWDIDSRALKGYEGIFSHTSYRKDKLDCHPQPELVNLLKNLR